MLKSFDIAVALTIGRTPGIPSPELARQTGKALSSCHGAVQRLVAAELVDADGRQLRRQWFVDFLAHGLRFVFPVERLGTRTGVPTAWDAPSLHDTFGGGGTPFVWPHPGGPVRGEGIAPLFPGAGQLASQTPWLYDQLAMLDAVRLGSIRERDRALALIDASLHAARMAAA